MSGVFYLRKYSHLTKLEQRTQIFVRLGSKLSGLHPFDNMVIINGVKGRL